MTSFMVLTTSPSLSSAAGVYNEDFSSWSQDVDGLGEPIWGLDDFIIDTVNNSARIEADYWSELGNTSSTANDEAWFASTLYQDIDLSALAGQNLILSFDWNFSGQEASFDENFLVAFGDGSGNYYGADGNLGFLLNPLDYASGVYSIILDSSFLNATGWTLEFQMNTGFDGYGSYAEIDNVSLNAVSKIAAVPEPSMLFLMISGLICLGRVRHTNKIA